MIIKNITLWNRKKKEWEVFSELNHDSEELRKRNIDIGNDVTIGSNVRIESRNTIYSSVTIEKGDVWRTIQNIGSRNSGVTYNVTKDFISCGCWTGNLFDFKKRVITTHKDNEFAVEYLGLIEYLEKLRQ